MNKHILRYSVVLVLVLLIEGCNKYERTEVVPQIYANKSLINGFVGLEVQLTASPTDGTYAFQWTSEDPEIATVTSTGLVKLISEGSTTVVLSAGDIKQRILVTSLMRIPVEDIILSETSIELIPLAKKTIAVQILPQEANDIPTPVWSTENDKVATVNEKGEIIGVSEGTTNISYRVGAVVKKVQVVVSYTRPFNGPHNLQTGPAVLVMAADFDFGGLGYAFNDDSGNNVGNDNYRRGKGDTQSGAVEIEGNGDNIGYIDNGEWYQYTVTVKEAGIYKLEVLLSAAAASKYRVEVDDVNVAGSVDVASNGGWSNWVFHTPIILNLAVGDRKIKFVAEQANFNLRALRFTKE
ncbi:carbohydrate-binding protein [Sphingobacterium olei]|uniref:Carbohydrate-binding protein n=1 Tax=Sphingobacterium olei TaxID=2571155 RepID=A0A4U0P0S9_9SPHI|nr:Ig-like domain-containing protein [Sphingobacterium olei]TJZ60769.1 carbohydrate-binding protein [Sphingobacterium olei]